MNQVMLKERIAAGKEPVMLDGLAEKILDRLDKMQTGLLSAAQKRLEDNTVEVDSYDEFRDISTGAALGTEPFYHLDANVYQIFFSFWY